MRGGDLRDTGTSAALAAAPGPTLCLVNSVCTSQDDVKEKYFAESNPFLLRG